MNKAELSERISSLLNKYQHDLFFGEELQRLQQRIDHAQSSIVVVGQFSVGKSELINALLGEKLLAARRIESTKVLTRIHKCMTDEQRKIILHSQNGETRELSIHDIDRLDQYTTFQGSAETDELLSVDVYWPLQFLNEELLLVDTPGANSLTQSAFAVTEKEIDRAASVLFLFNGQKGIDQTDFALLEDLVKRRKKVFIVATHMDGLTDEEAASVISNVQKELTERLGWPGEAAIYPVSSTQALQARQQKNQSLLDSSNIQQLERALRAYMEKQGYLASELESIQYDLEMIEVEILDSEAEEQQEQEERERQRQLRIQRLQLLTKREYDLVKEYGYELLTSREKRLSQLLEEWKEKIDQKKKEYRKDFTHYFRQFRKNVIQEIQFSNPSVDKLKKEYLQYNEKMNERYKEIMDEFEELISPIPQDMKKMIEEEDTLFIENLEANKRKVKLNWPSFKQKIKKMSLNSRSIDYDKDLFIEYEQDRRELQDTYRKKQHHLEQIKKNKLRIEKESKASLRSLKEEHDRRVKGLGSMPAPEEKTKTKGILWWKKDVVVGYDYSHQDRWKSNLKQLQKNYEMSVNKRIRDFENMASELKRNEKTIMNDLEHIHSEIEELDSRLSQELFDALDNEKRAVQNFYKQVEDEIAALWKVQEKDATEWFHLHTDNVRKQFILFVEEALQAELKLIK